MVSRVLNPYPGPMDVLPLLQSTKLIPQTRTDSVHAVRRKSGFLFPHECQMRTCLGKHSAG